MLRVPEGLQENTCENSQNSQILPNILFQTLLYTNKKPLIHSPSDHQTTLRHTPSATIQ